MSKQSLHLLVVDTKKIYQTVISITHPTILSKTNDSQMLYNIIIIHSCLSLKIVL